MDRHKLNLKDLDALRKDKFLDGRDKTVFQGRLSGDVDVLESSLSEDVVRDRTALAQDVFRARVLRQRRI